MSARPIGPRIARRLRREIELTRHGRLDRVLLRRFHDPDALEREIGPSPSPASDASPSRPLLARISEDRLAEWHALRPAWAKLAIGQAAGPLHDRVTVAGKTHDLGDPAAWHRDPDGQAEWPAKRHARIRLDDPAKRADVRLQWEPARFHHALLLARAWLVTRDPAYPEAFVRQARSFLDGNPPFDSLHWTVGMEVAIRASAWIWAIDLMRGSPPIAREMDLLRNRLYLHGLFLEHHIERHPHGFTTNHALAGYAGLALLARFFEGGAAGARWMRKAAEGMNACLDEQVLSGGAHAEASLPYERFVLEAAVCGACALPPEKQARLRPGIRALARHLRAASLANGLPFVGDGDDSFFPPFALALFDDLDPLDPEPVLQAAACLCGDASLKLDDECREAAFLLGADALGDAPPCSICGGMPTLGPPPSVARPGFVRFTAGPFAGLFLARESHPDRRNWLPTHGHNDLLSLVLEVRERSLLIDPGTGAYALDRALRHRLRSTAAHSTLRVGDLEQSAIHEARTFEGPQPVACGSWEGELDPFDMRSWHEGFPGVRHTRRIRWRAGCLWIEDELAEAGAHAQSSSATRAGVASARASTSPAYASGLRSTIRFRLAEEWDLRLGEGASGLACASQASGLAHASGRWNSSGMSVEFLLRCPREGTWRIEHAPASRRYGEVHSAPVLVAEREGALPHRWLTAIRLAEAKR